MEAKGNFRRCLKWSNFVQYCLVLPGFGNWEENWETEQRTDYKISSNNNHSTEGFILKLLRIITVSPWNQNIFWNKSWTFNYTWSVMCLTNFETKQWHLSKMPDNWTIFDIIILYIILKVEIRDNIFRGSFHAWWISSDEGLRWCQGLGGQVYLENRCELQGDLCSYDVFGYWT